MKMIVEMKRERETPGTFRFAEVDAAGGPVPAGDVKLQTLYIKKAALRGAPPPERIRVTIEAD